MKCSAKEVLKFVHSIACSLLVSMLLSLAIQCTINITGEDCGEEQTNGVTGGSANGSEKCGFTGVRISALTLFYGAALVYLLSTIGTCLSSGYVIIFYMVCTVLLIIAFIGLVVYSIIDGKTVAEAVNGLTADAIPDRWGVWATIVKCVIVITQLIAFIIGSILVYIFLSKKKL